jgi:mRNA interferase HigB
VYLPSGNDELTSLLYSRSSQIAKRTIDALFAFCENGALMRLISRRPLREFWKSYPDAETSLRHWITAVESAAWKTFADVRKVFGSADQAGQFTVFNIAGNKYRLIVVIHYNTQRTYVRHIFTHKEYNKWEP